MKRSSLMLALMLTIVSLMFFGACSKGNNKGDSFTLYGFEVPATDTAELFSVYSLLDLSVYDNNGVIYDVLSSVSKDGNDIAITGNQFIVSQMGNYIIKYSIPTLGSEYIKTTTISVTDNVAPVVEVMDFDLYRIVDDVVDISKISVKDNSQEEITPTISVYFGEGTSEEIAVVDEKFAVTKVGIYRIEVTAKDSADNSVTRVIGINVRAKSLANEVESFADGQFAKKTAYAVTNGDTLPTAWETGIVGGRANSFLKIGTLAETSQIHQRYVYVRVIPRNSLSFYQTLKSNNSENLFVDVPIYVTNTSHEVVTRKYEVIGGAPSAVTNGITISPNTWGVVRYTMDEFLALYPLLSQEKSSIVQIDNTTSQSCTVYIGGIYVVKDINGGSFELNVADTHFYLNEDIDVDSFSITPDGVSFSYSVITPSEQKAAVSGTYTFTEEGTYTFVAECADKWYSFTQFTQTVSVTPERYIVVAEQGVYYSQDDIDLGDLSPFAHYKNVEDITTDFTFSYTVKKGEGDINVDANNVFKASGGGGSYTITITAEHISDNNFNITRRTTLLVEYRLRPTDREVESFGDEYCIDKSIVKADNGVILSQDWVDESTTIGGVTGPFLKATNERLDNGNRAQKLGVYAVPRLDKADYQAIENPTNYFVEVPIYITDTNNMTDTMNAYKYYAGGGLDSAFLAVRANTWVYLRHELSYFLNVVNDASIYDRTSSMSQELFYIATGGNPCTLYVGGIYVVEKVFTSPTLNVGDNNTTYYGDVTDGDTIAFSATNVLDSANTVYTIYKPDNTIEVFTSPQANYLLTMSGTYLFRLNAIKMGYETEFADKTLNVLPLYNIRTITINGHINSEIDLEGFSDVFYKSETTAQSGYTISYAVSFDGEPIELEGTKFSPAENGTYTVAITATNGTTTLTHNATITVSSRPAPAAYEVESWNHESALESVKVSAWNNFTGHLAELSMHDDSVIAGKSGPFLKFSNKRVDSQSVGYQNSFISIIPRQSKQEYNPANAKYQDGYYVVEIPVCIIGGAANSINFRSATTGEYSINKGPASDGAWVAYRYSLADFYALYDIFTGAQSNNAGPGMFNINYPSTTICTIYVGAINVKKA